MVSVATTTIGRPPSYGTISATRDNEVAIPVSYPSESKHYQAISDESKERQGEQYCLAAWFTLPYFRWHPRWFISTIRGAEWFHVYLWLAKDLAWTQDWNYIGIFSGFAAVFWSVYLLIQAFRLRNFIEVWHSFAQFLWLAANAWWMFAELHDHDFPDEPKLYPAHTRHAGYIMLFALAWLALFYLIIRPLSLLPPASAASLAAYDDAGAFETRLPALFPTWRSYENIHILFWLGKDCAWNHLWPVTWWIFAAPTVIVALDFVWTTSFHAGHGVDHAHYVVQFIWVLANLVWAYGELYLPDLDEPLPLLPVPDSPEGLATMRWWSGWVLMLAFAIVAALYAVWLPATLARRIPDHPHEHDLFSDFPEAEAAAEQPAAAARQGGGGKVAAEPAARRGASP